MFEVRTKKQRQRRTSGWASSGTVTNRDFALSAKMVMAVRISTLLSPLGWLFVPKLKKLKNKIDNKKKNNAKYRDYNKRNELQISQMSTLKQQSVIACSKEKLHEQKAKAGYHTRCIRV